MKHQWLDPDNKDVVIAHGLHRLWTNSLVDVTEVDVKCKGEDRNMQDLTCRCAFAWKECKGYNNNLQQEKGTIDVNMDD